MWIPMVLTKPRLLLDQASHNTKCIVDRPEEASSQKLRLIVFSSLLSCPILSVPWRSRHTFNKIRKVPLCLIQQHLIGCSHQHRDTSTLQAERNTCKTWRVKLKQGRWVPVDSPVMSNSSVTLQIFQVRKLPWRSANQWSERYCPTSEYLGVHPKTILDHVDI